MVVINLYCYGNIQMQKNSIFKYCASLALGLALSSNLCASYTIETFVGDGTTGLSGDGGPATTASLNFTQAVCVDSLGNIYAADTYNNRIRKISPSGTISTIAGTGTYGYSGDGGLATNAALINPSSICLDSSNNLYFSDSGNNVIRMISVGTNIISTIAGTGAAGYSGDGGAATAAMLLNPLGVFVDNTGYIYVADNGNSRVRRFTLGGTISTIAGDGAATTLNNPTSVYVDNAGRVYISETGNNRIRMFSGGPLTTVAGGGTGGDGVLATSARLSGPRGIFGDSAGNIYFADAGNQRIRRFTVGGIINTFAGNGTAGFSEDGGASTAAMINSPRAIFQDSSGRIYLSDSRNNRIRRLALTAPATSLTIEVNGTDSATVSAALAATTVRKTGSGTAVLSGNNSGASTLQFNAGLVQVSATNNMGASLAFAGGNMEITSGTVAVPAAAMNQAGRITTNASAAVSSIAAPYGSALLTIAGPGVVTAGDMSVSATPLSIPGVVHVGASSASKMPTGVATVLSGGLVKIMGATASSVPGATEIQSGGVLEVLASVAVPVHTSAADIFGTLKFNSGSILKLGAGVSWARNMRIGTAL